MSKTEMQILDLCRKERIDIHKFNDIYKLSQIAHILPSIFEICHIYIDNKDYQKTILKILNENMNEFEKWIEANKINQLNFVIYADSHSHLLVASVNTFSYDASIIYRATLHFNSFIEYLPEKINNVGHRNVIKIVKKMCKESKNVLQQSLVDACPDRNNNEYFALLKVLLSVGTSQKYRYYPSEFVRIEFFKTCKTLEQIQAFMKINQFIENVSMRLEYTVHFADVLKRNRKECEQLAGIISIVLRMCNSDVKIRRELGVRLLEVLTKLNLTTDVTAYKKLAFDSYQEIRDIASKYVLLDFDRDFLHNKITSHEYSDIYASTEIILRKDDHQYYIDILQSTIRDINISDAIEKNVYGMIVLANQCKVKIDQIDLIYKHCFDQCLKVFSNVQNGIESDEEPIAITVLWRTLKETIHYHIIHLNFAPCLQVITDVMLSINHLGLISYVFELFRARLRKESSLTDQKIRDTLKSIIDRILMNKYNLSRKGAGITLLFTAFAYNETNKTIVLEMLFKHQDQFEHRIDTHVIYTNILTRLAKLDENDQCALFTYAFRCLGHKEWKVKNAGTMLFANLMYKLFGNKAFDHNSKRYIFQDIREIIYENRNKAKYLVLCFYNRMKYLTEREIEFVAECKDLEGYFKLKTNKILHKEKHKPISIENKPQEPIEKLNDLCIRLFADFNNEDLNIRNEAMTIAKEIGFGDASNEYLKHLIVEDSIKNNYFDRLKASIKKCERIETKREVYKSENNNDFYDFDYLCELFNKDI